MNITLKEIPDTLHKKLRERAESHGRSLNKEVMTILETAINPTRRTPSDLLNQIEKRRNRLPHIVRDENLQQIIAEGRQ